jgi:hypothetical protein
MTIASRLLAVDECLLAGNEQRLFTRKPRKHSLQNMTMTCQQKGYYWKFETASRYS